MKGGMTQTEIANELGTTQKLSTIHFEGMDINVEKLRKGIS